MPSLIRVLQKNVGNIQYFCFLHSCLNLAFCQFHVFQHFLVKKMSVAQTHFKNFSVGGLWGRLLKSPTSAEQQWWSHQPHQHHGGPDMDRSFRIRRRSSCVSQAPLATGAHVHHGIVLQQQHGATCAMTWRLNLTSDHWTNKLCDGELSLSQWTWKKNFPVPGSLDNTDCKYSSGLLCWASELNSSGHAKIAKNFRNA